MTYEALVGLMGTCLGILTLGVFGVIGAFLFGFIGTRQRARKKWEFNYSLRAKEHELSDKSGLPINYREAIYFPSLTACLLYVNLVLVAFRWIVIYPNAQAIYDSWYIMYRGYNEGSLKALSGTVTVLMLIVSIAMGLAMRAGRRFKIARLERRENLNHGRTLLVRSRGLTIYVVCFIGTFMYSICSRFFNCRFMRKVRARFRRAYAAAKR